MSQFTVHNLTFSVSNVSGAAVRPGEPRRGLPGRMEAWGQVDEARPQGKQRVFCGHLDAALGENFAALIMALSGCQRWMDVDFCYRAEIVFYWHVAASCETEPSVGSLVSRLNAVSATFFFSLTNKRNHLVVFERPSVCLFGRPFGSLSIP
jgi:hypothetical protein